MGYNKMPSGKIVVPAISGIELANTMQESRNVSVYVPLRMPTSPAWLHIAAISVMA